MSHVDSTSPVTHVSLCAGYGGIDLGLHRAIRNLRTIAVSEIEAFACANLVAKMEAGLLDPAPIWTDLKTFPWSDFRDRVDILSGGYPCQPFSAAGKRLGAEDPRHLWPFISAGIAAMRPSACFFENVDGHISMGLPDVLQDLVGLGYRTTWCVASASECGAPHQRKRVFILAHRKNIGLPGAINAKDQSGSEWWQRLSAARANRSTSWPSRPGEQQHAWEPPRVVANNHRPHAGHGEQRPERTLGDLSGGRGEAMGNSDPRRLASGINAGSGAEADRGGQGDIEQADGGAMGNSLMHGHAAGEITGGTGAGETEGRVQKPSGGSASMGNAAEPRCQGSRRANDPRGSTHRLAEPVGGCANGPVESGERQTQPPLGGDLDGPADGLGYAELCVTCDNRTDELRLLGNGVVPACAERAFRLLVSELMEHQP